MTTCRVCGEHTMVPDDLEDTGICNLCAQEDARRLEWLNSQRGCVRGTDFPLWSIEGTREDGRNQDQHIREAIDEAMEE